MQTKAFLIAGAGSGTGKTTVSLGLMAAFKRQGMRVQGFKAGPDYIDPSLHRVVTGRPSINLDTWMMTPDFLLRSFESRAAKADISIIEGVMGLHDGRAPDSPEGSTAELAVTLGVPVILVINAKSMARTAAAIINGLIDFDKRVNIIGVIFNNIGSPNHLEILKKSISTYCSVPVLGGIPVVKDIKLPSRHLGLFMGEEGVLENRIDRLADTISEHIDLEKILTAANMDIEDKPLFDTPSEISKGRIAVARDNAFCFYYDDNFEILRNLGYDIVFFSPLRDTSLPENIKAIYLGGGYPELYADSLARNTDMRSAIKVESEKGTFIYAECGGLMYLGRTLTDINGTKHDMCGCMPYDTLMQGRLQSLGYTEITPMDNFLFLKKGKKQRGHCFHYSELIMDDNAEVDSFYDGTPVDKAKGFRLRNTLVSYVHLHLGSYFFKRGGETKPHIILINILL
ncbi:MAG: cobyrinate a,c-diamide synthase [Deltaproteobacteria bacterium]|nr:cobyrinate a,c-diamide synthase [Deltaproteobacteria bacterium]